MPGTSREPVLSSSRCFGDESSALPIECAEETSAEEAITRDQGRVEDVPDAPRAQEELGDEEDFILGGDAKDSGQGDAAEENRPKDGEVRSGSESATAGREEASARQVDEELA